MSQQSLSFLQLALPAPAQAQGACQQGDWPTLVRISPQTPSSPKACRFLHYLFSIPLKKKKSFCFCLILILKMEKHSLLLVSNQKGCRSLNQLKPPSPLAFLSARVILMGRACPARARVPRTTGPAPSLGPCELHSDPP